MVAVLHIPGEPQLGGRRLSNRRPSPTPERIAMSYSISISGHKKTGGHDESEAFENEVAAKAREFVASLEGVTSATGSFGVIGTQDLKATE